MALEAASSSDPPGEVVRTHVVAVREPPTVPSLSAVIDEWEIAGTPEESQFFSTEVGARGKTRGWLLLIWERERDVKPRVSKMTSSGETC